MHNQDNSSLLMTLPRSDFKYLQGDEASLEESLAKKENSAELIGPLLI